MSKTVNNYFNVLGAKGEQRLVEDLVIESIRINGMAMYYVPRTLVNVDPVFGEDPLSCFEKYFQIEMYMDSAAEGWGGDRYLISKFGLEMRETSNMIVSRRRFTEVMKHGGYNQMPNTQYTVPEVRPLEGDLIYVPFSNDLFQINFVEHESVFHQIGKLYIWRLDIQKYDYSAETIKTGVLAIDRVQQIFDNVDNVFNDPLAENADIMKEGEKIITPTNNVFGDPV